MSKPDLDILDKLESSVRMWPVDTTTVSSVAADGTMISNEVCEPVAYELLCESQNPAGESDSSENQQLLNLPGDHTAPSSRGSMSRGTVCIVSVDPFR